MKLTKQYGEEIFDEMEDSFGLSKEITIGNQQANSFMLKHDIYGIANKVRRIVKDFKRSSLKDDILQNYAQEKHPNGLQLMIARPVGLHSYSCSRGLLKNLVQKALLDLKADTKICDEPIF